MASRDIRTTKERIQELYSVQDQIRQAIKGYKDSQKYWDRMVRVGWNNYEDIHYNILNKHADIDAILQQAYTDLAAFRTANGGTFQYVWEAGKNGVHHFAVTTTTINGVDEAGNVMTTLWSDSDFNGGGAVSLITANHFIKIENAEDAANNGIFQPNGTQTVQNIVFSGATLTANASDETMKITYWATS